MIDRLAPFFPALVVFLGAILVAAGGFWAAWRQSNFNAEIRNKNETIIGLQQENTNAITGGDSFAYVGFRIFSLDGKSPNANAMPDDLFLVPDIIHSGKYPLYDVKVRFHQTGVPSSQSIAGEKNYPLGNLAPGFATSSSVVRFQHHGKDINYNIFFAARNGGWVQILRMRWMGNGWAAANKVLKGKTVLLREVSNNFPRTEDGKIDWQEQSALETEPNEK